MIDELRIDGFKSLRNIELEPRALNVLVGPNGSGKSSVLQSLLLIRQSVYAKPEKIDSLHLSGELYEAGMPLDAIHPAANHTIAIMLSDNAGFEIHGKFSYDRDDDAAANVRILSGDPGGTLDADAIDSCELFSRSGGFSYLNAERIGPRLTQDLPLGGEGIDGRLGKYGQFTAAFLARAFSQNTVTSWNDENFVNFSKAISALGGDDLVEQFKEAQGSLFRLANIMLAWIIPGAEFSAAENLDTDNAVLSFTRDAGGTKTKTRSTHVGFGLSYVLPVIVAALALPRDGLLLVENPEAHLHPYSQSRMGAFLALIASTERQIFVETHSDHVVNGIRLAVKLQHLSAANVRIYYFRNSMSSDQSEMLEIEVDEKGGLSSWPKGFFDQIEQDLSRL